MMKQAVDENIDALSRAIMTDARSEADQLLEDARAKAESIKKQAQEQAEAERKQILDRANQEAARIRSQVISTTQLKARTMQLEHREKLLDKVFQTAQQELSSVQQWKDYDEIAQNLLREALMQLEVNEVRILADKRTMSAYSKKFLDDLSQEMNVKISEGDPLEQGVGVIVETVDKHMQYDNTLETRLRRMQNNLRSPVNHLLMGESL
jgi:V/A-type H+-transporting ATPase subunit E